MKEDLYNILVLLYTFVAYIILLVCLYFIHSKSGDMFTIFVILVFVSLPSILLNVKQVQCSKDCSMYVWMKFGLYILYIILGIVACILLIINQLEPSTETKKPTEKSDTSASANTNTSTNTSASTMLSNESEMRLSPTYNIDSDYIKVGYLLATGAEQPIVLPLYRKNAVYKQNFSYFALFDGVQLEIKSAGKRCQDKYGCPEIFNGDTINVPAYTGKSFIAHIGES